MDALAAATRLAMSLAELPCVESVGVVRPDDTSTWKLEFTKGATAAQKRAANTFLGVDPAAPTDADVTAEYRRRLFAILGADDMAHAGFLRADNEAEARRLSERTDLSDTETAWFDELRRIGDAAAHLIERYNAIPSPPPADFKSDEYWS